MPSHLLIALLGGVLSGLFGVVVLMLRRLGRDVDHVGALTYDTRGEVGGLRVEVREVGRRVKRIEQWQDEQQK